MALFRKFFYRKPPDGLLEITERVYVFDSCFTTDVFDDDKYQEYIGDIVDPLLATSNIPKVLYSTPKRSKYIRLYKKADSELIKIDMHCHIQGDVVLECISLDADQEREEMMFRVMFNTAFIRSNILMLNRDEIDLLWDAKDRFPKEFRTEVLFSEMDTANQLDPMEMAGIGEKEGLPIEAFAKVQEMFSNVDWLDPTGDAAIQLFQRLTSSENIQLRQGFLSPRQHPTSGAPVVKKAMPPPSSLLTPETLVPLDAIVISEAKDYSQSALEHSGLPSPPQKQSAPHSLGASTLPTHHQQSSINVASRRSNLKPLHWVKVTRAMQGSLWAESQKPEETLKAPVFDMSELENLFSAVLPSSDARRSDKSGSRASGPKSEKIHLIDLRKANNCGIMLTKVKMPLPDLMSAILALDDAVLDADQVDNLIKFTPTKDEIELLKGYKGDIQLLGECEKFFMELMKLPRVESKLRVFSFKIQFRSQVSDLKRNLNIVNTSAEEIRGSVKLKRIMQTILSLGNALNQGTARGSAVGFRLDSLLKLSDTRARNNKTTLMHYLSKVLSEKLPELLDFPKDLSSLELAAKIQLKSLAEEMQAVNKGLEKVEQELTTSENDGPVSEIFRKTLKDFLIGAEAEVRALTSLYASVGRNADALALYFGEDPARCPFEQVVTTLQNFVRLFMRSHEENCKQLDFEKKKALKEAEENCKQLDIEKKKAQKEAEENCKQLDLEKKKAQKEAEENCKLLDLQMKNAQMEAENKCKQLDLEKKKAQMEAEQKCKQLDLEKKKAQKDAEMEKTETIESENDRASKRESQNGRGSMKESANEKALINNSIKELDIPLQSPTLPLQSPTQAARAK
ncbi:hypothetical protein QOZ80_8BG0653630 [Eleusine coracana subsp. coracana]|nr:hypothetical protein QOZ80_8BG0653630 [Eleusine coracana subsp. coracana]